MLLVVCGDSLRYTTHFITSSITNAGLTLNGKIKFGFIKSQIFSFIHVFRLKF